VARFDNIQAGYAYIIVADIEYRIYIEQREAAFRYSDRADRRQSDENRGYLCSIQKTAPLPTVRPGCVARLTRAGLPWTPCIAVRSPRVALPRMSDRSRPNSRTRK
jgi:hypothetical protein